MSVRLQRAFVLVFFCAFMVLQTLSVNAASVTVSWNSNAEETLAGYRVYSGSNSGDYAEINDVGDTTNHVITDLEAGKTIYIAATAYDIYGNESGFSQEVSYTLPSGETPETDPDPTPQGDTLIETGEVTTDHTWTSVHLTKNFVDPIVVANLSGFEGTDPSTIRLRNVTSSGFEIRVQEWDYLDVTHASEIVGYIVVERGTHVLTDGTRVEAGKISTSQTSSFGDIKFSTSFPSVPVVATSIASAADDTAVTGRVRNISGSGFEYRMQEEEKNDQSHSEETVMYIAWEESRGTYDDVTYEVKRSAETIANEFQTISLDSVFDQAPILVADMQTFAGSDPAALRYQGKTTDSFSIMVQEEKSLDDELIHAQETFGYMAFAQNETSQDSDSDQSTDDSTDTSTDPDTGSTPSTDTPLLEIGEVEIDHTWTTVVFEKTFQDPVVVSTGLSYEGTDPSTIRIKNVNANGFEISVQEWDYLDTVHCAESAGYMVLERGITTLEDGTKIYADTVTTDATNAFENVGFPEQMTDVPVVLSGITSLNGNAAVTTRIKNISQTGFEIGMQEEENNDQTHSAEEISFIAWEKSSGSIDGQSFEIGTATESVDHTFQAISFATDFAQTPIFIGGMQTVAGIDPASVRRTDLSRTGCEVMVEEEKSLDSEMAHSPETIGYMVFDR